MLKEGDRVPDVKLEGLEGQPISPTDFRGQKLVLYFYPKDDTTGCTREAKDFTDLSDEFEHAGTWVLGVSRDDRRKHRKFIDKHGLKVSLASDVDGCACETFGTWVEKSMYGRKYMGIERCTFLLDGQGIVRGAWRKVRVPGHVAEVLKAARAL